MIFFLFADSVLGNHESDAESEARMVTQVESDEQQLSVNTKDQNHVVSTQSNIRENGDKMKASKRKLSRHDGHVDESDEEDFAGFDSVDTSEKSGNYFLYGLGIRLLLTMFLIFSF